MPHSLCHMHVRCVSEMHVSTFHFLHSLYAIVAFLRDISHDGWKINETHINICASVERTGRRKKESENENWSDVHTPKWEGAKSY